MAVFDALSALDDRHDCERFARRCVVQVLGRSVSVPTAEDVIINKLRWWKLAGRGKDSDDARNVMAVQRAVLDRDYLHRWCRELDLLDQLETLDASLR